MKKNNSERGQALVLLALGIVGLLSLTALALDGGNAFADRRAAQNAADNAAYAAALAYVNDTSKANNPVTWESPAYDLANENGYARNTARSTVTITNVDASAQCPNKVAGRMFRVEIASNLDTFFASIVGVEQVHNRVFAVAKACQPTVIPVVVGQAVVALKEHGDAVLWANGGPTVNITGGGLFVNSDGTCAFNQNGSGSVSAPSLSTVGGYCAQSPTSSHVLIPGSGITQDAPSLDAQSLIENIPTPVCSYNATISGGVVSPGADYTGNISGKDLSKLNIDLFFQPGIYCITDDWTVNGTQNISGANVLFYQKTGALQWNGSGTLSLSGRTAGTYKGLLIYLDPANPGPLKINGNSSNAMVGTILAPSADADLKGTGASLGFDCQVIAYTVQFSGNAAANIQYSKDKNFQKPVPPSITLVQ